MPAKFILSDTEVYYDESSKKDKMCTVYVPFDCGRNCAFCISKPIYSGECSVDGVKATLARLAASDVQEIVFTGGEPMANLAVLKELIDIVSMKNVYINTSFISDGSEAFISLVNATECIKGVNISRHKKDIVDEAFGDSYGFTFELAGFSSDEQIAKITKPVRINIVIDNVFAVESIPEYVNRWSAIRRKDFDITFRRMYQQTDYVNLHALSDPVIDFMTEKYHYTGHMYCHVCDKMMFRSAAFSGNEEGGLIRYHRGMQNTRIEIGRVIEMQELVCYPDGSLCTDWDGSKDGLEEYCALLNIL